MCRSRWAGRWDSWAGRWDSWAGRGIVGLDVGIIGASFWCSKVLQMLETWSKESGMIA